jgi:hypothetical protein
LLFALFPLDPGDGGFTQDLFGLAPAATWAGIAVRAALPAAPDCGTRCVPEHLRIFTLITATKFATSTGVGSAPLTPGETGTTGEGDGRCEVPLAVGGIKLRIILHRSGGGIGGDGGGAENGGGCARIEGAEISVTRKEWEK